MFSDEDIKIIDTSQIAETEEIINDVRSITGVRRTVLKESLTIFKNRKDLSELTDKDYKYYSSTVDTKLNKLSANGAEQAKKVKEDKDNILEKLKNKAFTALQEQAVSFAIGLPDEIFDVAEVVSEVKKSQPKSVFKPTLNPYKTAEQQYEEYLLNK